MFIKFLMFFSVNCAKQLKIQEDNKDCPGTLHNVCNWFYVDKPAIEYHELDEIKIINYNELQTSIEAVSKHLKCIQSPEFIGINFDILEYCVPTLMLG